MGIMPSRLLGRGARVAASWSAEERDAVLYAAAALFAIVTAQGSSISLYKQWGWLAVGPYTGGAVASAVAAGVPTIAVPHHVQVPEIVGAVQVSTLAGLVPTDLLRLFG